MAGECREPVHGQYPNRIFVATLCDATRRSGLQCAMLVADRSGLTRRGMSDVAILERIAGLFPGLAAQQPPRRPAKPIRADLQLPDEATLLTALATLAAQVDPIARCLAAYESGHFLHPDGRTDPLGGVTLMPAQAAVLAHLCHVCPAPLSIETGFGMGSSASVVMGARRHLGADFEHLAFDPFGLADNRGTVVEAYLSAEFGARFRRVRERSEIGLGKLLDERGEGAVGLAFIDGCHHFENVIVDFTIADLLCCEGGFIVLHDARYPAIESAISYISNNRPDYAVAHLAVSSLTVLQKRSADERSWDSFTPFSVPDRYDWTPRL